MRTTLAAVFMIALALPAGAQTSAAAAGDEAAIRKLVQQHDAARNAGDWKAMGAGFTDDADQLTSAGDWRKGRAAIEKGVAQVMAGPYKGGKYSTKIDSVRRSCMIYLSLLVMNNITTELIIPRDETPRFASRIAGAIAPRAVRRSLRAGRAGGPSRCPTL